MRIETPRNDFYDLFLSARDNSGNYAPPNNFQIEHPGIQQLILDEQDVEGLIASVKISLPKAYSETSQTVLPTDEQSEEKEILGYRLYVQELDYETEDPIGDEEVIDYDAKEINEKGVIYYQAETGKKFEFKVGVYDSVYHPTFNPSLYQQTISQTQTAQTMKISFPDISETLIKPDGLTATLAGEGLTEDDFGETGIQPKYTLQAGIWDEDNEEPIVGGIGLAYNEEENDIDVQIVANRLRLFDPDVDPEGSALFAVGTVDGESQIYMNANQIAMIAENTDLSGEDPFFNLSGEGLAINTPGLQLDKTGNAIFAGELEAAKGTFTGELEAVSGTFSGSLDAVGGTFTGKLEAGGEVLLDTIGLDAETRGTNSISFGNNSYVNGDNCVSIGRNSVASGDNNVAIGYDSYAKDGSISIGDSNYSYQYSCSVGFSAGSDNGSISLGNKAYADYHSVALGYDAEAKGEVSGDGQNIAIGYRSSCKDDSEDRIAIGTNSSISGSSSHTTLIGGGGTATDSSTSIGIGRDITLDGASRSIVIGAYQSTSKNYIIKFPIDNFPTSDPHEEGCLWRNGTDLKVSTG